MNNQKAVEQTESGKGERDAGLENPSRARAPMVSPRMRAKAIATLADSMNATRRFWDKQTQQWIEEPDWTVRHKSAELVLAYTDGRPVEMKVELTGGFEGYDAKLAKLCSTPEGLKLAVQAGLVGDAIPKIKKLNKAMKTKDLQRPEKTGNDQKPVSQEH